ncbi:hypothetical protein EV715DRAFT_214622 [Schizophyllum commune]
MQVPQELKDAIVDYIYESGDTSSLLRISRASRTFSGRAQNLLFCKVAIADPMSATLFYESLAMKPSLRDSVKALHITHSGHGYAWIPLDRSVPSILRSLPSLEEFHFHPSSLPMPIATSRLSDGILHILSLQTLRRVSIARIDYFPLSALHRAAHLCDLQLAHVTFDLDRPHDEAHTIGSLTSLTLVLTYTALAQMEAHLTPPSGVGWSRSLKCLRITIIDTGNEPGEMQMMFACLARVLTQCASSVVSLELGGQLCPSDGAAAQALRTAFASLTLPAVKLLAFRDIEIKQRTISTHMSRWLPAVLSASPGVMHIAVMLRVAAASIGGKKSQVTAYASALVAEILKGNASLALESLRFQILRPRHRARADAEAIRRIEYGLQQKFSSHQGTVSAVLVHGKHVSIATCLGHQVIDTFR